MMLLLSLLLCLYWSHQVYYEFPLSEKTTTKDEPPHTVSLRQRVEQEGTCCRRYMHMLYCPPFAFDDGDDGDDGDQDYA